MKFAILFGPMCLAFRGSFDFTVLRTDPRGMTGSELGFIRIADELQAAGHEVELRVVAEQTEYRGMRVRPLSDPLECDVAIAINEPDLLRQAPAGCFRVCAFWLNDTSFCRVGFDDHVDLFLSPSDAHLEQVMTNLEWSKVEKTPEFPDGKAQYVPDAAKWVAVPLGCDPERFYDQNLCPKCRRPSICEEQYAQDGSSLADKFYCIDCGPLPYPHPSQEKIPHRVVHCSSPDRGLHHLLSAWPEIRAAVPDATLHIFYRLGPWLRGFDQTPYFPPIEPLRKRANYVEECLRRFQERGGMGVTLRDSVSRETIEREMAQAEVMAYSCDTTTWSEGFSCTVLEACAARACPIISDCDALGSVYAELDPVPRGPGWVKAWTARVIEALLHPAVREEQNSRAYALASKLTWKIYVEKVLKEIACRRMTSPSEPESVATSTSLQSSATTKPPRSSPRRKTSKRSSPRNAGS